MAKKKHASRLNLAYLAARHGGTLFFFLALGLAGGLVWRSLFAPTRYRAEATLDVDIDPAATSFDWRGKLAEWPGIVDNSRDRRLLGINLRYALKHAITRDIRLDTETLPAELALFAPTRRFSETLLSGMAARLGPAMEVSLRDFAGNLDHQSLATIVADLDPPAEARDWDFSFYALADPGASFIITRPGERDRFFKVFYHLYRLLNNGADPVSPEEAWRTAAATLAERLERENQFHGGGGFGHLARRELIRELAAVPALAANALYSATGQSFGDGDFRWQADLWDGRWLRNVAIEATRQSDYDGRINAAMELDLNPLVFPRDTALTRIPPLALQTLLAYVAARETDLTPAPAPTHPEPAPVVQVETPPPAPEPEPEVVVTVVEPLLDNTKRIRELESDLLPLRTEHSAALLRLETAKTREKTAAADTEEARSRADRLWKEFEALNSQPEPVAEEVLSPEEAALRLSRAEILERLAELLQYCTEEHPFVRQARRELNAVEALLSKMDTTPRVNREAEERAARLSALRLEWEAADKKAADFERRRLSIVETMEDVAAYVANLEKRIVAVEIELSELAEAKAGPVARKAVATPAPAPAKPAPAPASKTPAGSPAPAPASAVRVVFSAIPTRIPLYATAPGWGDVVTGAVLGMFLGLCCLVIKEFLSTKFHSVGEARRLLPMPVLAALPAYDKKTFRSAAAAMKGEVVDAPGRRLTFIPAPVEFAEPAAAVKRPALRPARYRRGLLPWLAGLCLLIAAGIVAQRAASGRARPNFRGNLELPAAEFTGIDAVPGARWGDLP